MSIHSFERRPLLFGPSPVHQLERLTSHLGGAGLIGLGRDLHDNEIELEL